MEDPGLYDLGRADILAGAQHAGAICPDLVADRDGRFGGSVMRGTLSFLAGLIWVLTPAVRNLEDRSPGQDQPFLEASGR